MNKRKMHALAGIPTKREQCVTVVIPVEELFTTQVAVPVGDFRVSSQDALKSVAVVVYGIHRRISSLLGSNTIALMTCLAISNCPTGSLRISAGSLGIARNS